MKLRTSIAALIVGFSPAAVWAGAATDSVVNPQEAHQQGAAVSDPANTNDTAAKKTPDPSARNVEEESGGWQYMNGRALPGEHEGMQSEQAANEETGAEQVAVDEMAAEQAAGDDQANAESVTGSESDLMANLPGSRSDDQTMGLQGIPGGVEDKLVVILPRDWQGSLPDLLAALEQTSETAEILVLKREGQPDDMSPENAEEADRSDSTTR